MLSPIDFIFNSSDQIPEYAEFNHKVLESESYIYNPSTLDYTFKYSHNFNTSSVHHHISKNTSNFNSDSLFNVEFAKQFVQSLKDSKTPYSSTRLDNSLLFPGVRCFAPGIVIFEKPPCYKVLPVTNAHRDSIDSNSSFSEYYLPIPWQVYIAMYNPSDMRLVNVKMFFASTSLHSFDQEIYAPPLYNFYSNGTLCRPFFSSMDDIEKYSKDISGVIASAYDWIWNSGFNYDITENISYFLYTKEFTQFEQYIKPEHKVYYNWLVDHQLNYLPSTLNSRYHAHFFKCWEDIPLSEVSSIKWSPFTSTSFYFQHLSSSRNDILDQYINENDFVIPDDEEDHYHDEEYCHPDCITVSEILSSSGYIAYLTEFLSKENSILLQAFNSSVEYLKSNELVVTPNSRVLSYNSFRSFMENIVSTF